jgi:hypothetical protein
MDQQQRKQMPSQAAFAIAWAGAAAVAEVAVVMISHGQL